MNIKNILISQSQTDKAAYDALEAKYGIKVHFKPFITIRPVSMKTFRAQKINILDYTAIVFTSKNAVDIFFQFCKELKIEMPPEMKYFCVNETTANYIQHHVQMRKRKVFVGKGNNQDLFPLFKKHNAEKYLYPCSEIRKADIPDFMKENNIAYKELIIYETVSAELKDINIEDYQLIAFFSPSGVVSLKENFPNYKQNETLFAAFGSTTAKAIQEMNFRVDIQAPIPQIPSMVGAIELKLKELSDPKAYKKYVKHLEQRLEQQIEEEKRIKEEQERERLLKQRQRQKQKQSKKASKRRSKRNIEVITKIEETPVKSENTKKTTSTKKTQKTASAKVKIKSTENNEHALKNKVKKTESVKTIENTAITKSNLKKSTTKKVEHTPAKKTQKNNVSNSKAKTTSVTINTNPSENKKSKVKTTKTTQDKKVQHTTTITRKTKQNPTIEAKKKNTTKSTKKRSTSQNTPKEKNTTIRTQKKLSDSNKKK